MKLIVPRADIAWGLWELIAPAPLQRIEKVARVSHKSEGAICEGSDVKLVKKLRRLGHDATLEFHDVCVKFTTDRGISHELVRHRLCSFMQESTRWCNYGDGHVQFVYPYFAISSLTGPPPDGLVFNNMDDVEWFVGDMELPEHGQTAEWLRALCYAEMAYKAMLNDGCKPQGARSVLPNSLKTEIFCKANLREWRLIFSQRCAGTAHPDIRRLMFDVLKEFNKAIPVVFDDLYDKFIDWT